MLPSFKSLHLLHLNSQPQYTYQCTLHCLFSCAVLNAWFLNHRKIYTLTKTYKTNKFLSLTFRVPPIPQPSKSIMYDESGFQNEQSIPTQFIWPDEEKPCSQPPPELDAVPINLGGFLSGDTVAVSTATRLVNEACKKHGFFSVINHSVDAKLLAKAQHMVDFFFAKPISQKQKAQRKNGDHCGYSSSFVGRFATKLPWKETLSFRYSADDTSLNSVENYIVNVMGQEYQEFG